MFSCDPGCTEISHLDCIEILTEPWSWEFAAVHRAKINEHFISLKRKRPAIWNGRVLLLNRLLIRNATLLGSCFETDYASFIAWQNWNCPDPTVYNFFAVAALRAADGAYLIGEMAPYTARGGRIYFPCGTPDPSAINDRGAFDPIDHLNRELREETGLSMNELDVEPGWVLARDRCSVALIRRLTSRENADDLRRRIMCHIRSEQQPELSDVYIVRGPAQLDARMTKFVTAFLQEQWRQGATKT
jgi:hypothetical protein